tara:strand:+ start:2302 stop:2880 length:579 start_codon:yes stop_codon:yes gene_type:complete
MIYKSFVNELRKIAAGPLVIDVDDISLLNGRAVHVLPDGILSPKSQAHHIIRNKFPQAIAAAEQGKSVILLPSKKNLASSPYVGPDAADAAYNQLRRHEMTHWLRWKKGKKGMEISPGVRGVVRNAREEFAASVSQVKTRGLHPAQQKLMASQVIPSTVASVKGNYAHQGGVKKALMGGKAGKALRFLRRIR